MEWSALTSTGNGFSFFNVLLECRSTQTKQLQKLYFTTFPNSVIDIKLKIEECFSIPLCVQELRYQSVLLNDDEVLRSHHIRFEDTFNLSYLATGDCKDMKSAIEWLNQVLALLSTENITITSGLSPDLVTVLQEGAYYGHIINLKSRFFMPWSDDEKCVNRLHFHAIHGLEALLGVHKRLVAINWFSLPQILQHLERTCIHTLCNFSMLLAHRRSIVQLGGLSQCFASLFRVRIVKGNHVQPHEMVLENIMENALCTINNLAELPEHCLALAKKSELLQQVRFMSLSPSYTCFTSIVSASLFLNLSHSYETHTHLGRLENTIDLLGSCERWSNYKRSNDPELMSLRGYTSLALASLALISPTVIHPDVIVRVTSLAEQVLSLVSPSGVNVYEEQEGITWFTMLPYFKLLYYPMSPLDNQTTTRFGCQLTQLQLSSISVVLLMLQSFLKIALHRDVVVKEGLVDYLVCLPWHVPHTSTLRARNLVREFGTHVQLQPPSLCNLAKARLAKMEFGLETVMTVSSASWFANALSFGTQSSDDKWVLPA